MKRIKSETVIYLEDGRKGVATVWITEGPTDRQDRARRYRRSLVRRMQHNGPRGPKPNRAERRRFLNEGRHEVAKAQRRAAREKR